MVSNSGVFYRAPNFLATVVSKSGTTVTVRRLGDPATAAMLGPYATEAGVSGFVVVGDTVLVDRTSGTPLVRMPVEGAERLALSIAGQDLESVATASHTEWATLLDVGGLAIPAGVPFRVEWHTEIVTIGQAGATAKQARVLFNNTEAITIALQSAAGVFWIPFLVSTYTPTFAVPKRSALLLTATTPTVIAVPLGVITRVTVQARTNDTGEGNDTVRCAQLVVSL